MQYDLRIRPDELALLIKVLFPFYLQFISKNFTNIGLDSTIFIRTIIQ